MPFSSFDSQAPEDLWAWMDKQREQGIELLAISHNANVSDGLMYPSEVDFKGRPIDKAWAEARMRNERLIEIKQIKGASETHPLLSPTDEFANFEIMSYLLGDPEGRFPRIPGSYLRDALKTGIAMQDTRGYNPYKPGIVAGSDSHNGAAPYRQDNYFGGHAREDGGLKERMAGHVFAGGDIRLMNPAGLSAIWAEENTRASLFDGMQRKETFATSGVRIKLRFFGGWGLDDDFARGLGEEGLRQRCADGRRPAGGRRQGAVVPGLGAEGPDLGQPRPGADRQGLDATRPDLREGLRRGLGRRSQAGLHHRPRAGRSVPPSTCAPRPTRTPSARPS